MNSNESADECGEKRNFLFEKDSRYREVCWYPTTDNTDRTDYMQAAYIQYSTTTTT